MRRVLPALALAAALTAAPLAARADAAPSPSPSATSSPTGGGQKPGFDHWHRIGGVPVSLRSGTRQLVTVDHTNGWHAIVRLWVVRRGTWQDVLTAYDGRTGSGGLVAGKRRVQGTDTTPLGTYRLTSAFGTHPKAASWRLPYRRIGKGDFWVEDNASRFYNRWRNQAQGGFRWWLPSDAVNSSERLSDYPVQYEYAVVTSFNHRQVRHRGAGIFLHVNGRAATGGCVSAPRWFLRAVLARLKPVARPMIAIGR